MVTTKGLAISAGLITGAAGLTGIVGYSTGLFDSDTQIIKLLEEENKYSLLPTGDTTHAAEWAEAWANYKKDNKDKKVGEDKWKLSDWKSDLENMTSDFKNVCSQKSSENVKSKEDSRYIDITKYCSRPKTLQEVLKQEGISDLLSTENQNEAWTTKYSQYQNSNNKLPDTTINSFEKLREGCKVAASLKATDTNYQKTYEPFKTWCRR